MANCGTGSSSHSSSSEVKKDAETEYILEMRRLNNAFMTDCQVELFKNSGGSLVPLIKEYLFYSRALVERRHKGGVARSSSSYSSLKDLGEFWDEFERTYVTSTNDLELEGAVTEEDDNNNKVSSSSKLKSSSSSRVVTSTFASVPSSIAITKPLVSRSTHMFTAPPPPQPSSTARGRYTSFPLVPARKQEPSEPNSNAFSASPHSPPRPAVFANVLNPPSPPLASAPVFGLLPVLFGGHLAGSGSSDPPTGASFTFSKPLPTIITRTANSWAQKSHPAESKAEDQGQGQEENDKNDEEPPKNEVIPVIEEDSVYSMKCKVFGLTGGQYKDKGVGTLYIKLLSEDKYQLLIRADNNLGTLLLNILLQKSLPLEKKSAKDVMTFDVSGNGGKGMPILLRAKSEDAANELLSQLKNFQR